MYTELVIKFVALKPLFPLAVDFTEQGKQLYYSFNCMLMALVEKVSKSVEKFF